MAHHRSLSSEIDQSSHSLNLDDNQEKPQLDSRCSKSTSAILAGHSCENRNVTDSTEKPPSNKTGTTEDDQPKMSSQENSSPTEPDKDQCDIELMPYTTEDIREALGEIQKEVPTSCSPPEEGGKRFVTNTADSSLRSSLTTDKAEEHVVNPSSARTSDDSCKNIGIIRSSNHSSVGQSGVLDEGDESASSATTKKFMGELLSPRDADTHDLSDHEIVSKSDLLTETENGRQETKSPPPGPRRKTVRFLLDENDSPSDGLSKKVSGLFTSSSSSLSLASSSSSTSDFGSNLPGQVEPIIEEVSDSPGSDVRVGIDRGQVDIPCEMPSPTIYFSEKELPLITCPNQERVFELEDIIPKEILVSVSPPVPPDLSSVRVVPPQEQLFAPVQPFVEIPLCDGGCPRYHSEVARPVAREDMAPSGTATQEISPSNQLHHLGDLPAPFTVIEPDPYLKFDEVDCFNTSFIKDPQSEMRTMGNNIGFPDEVVYGSEVHRGSFTADDLPMSIPTAFKNFHAHGSEESSSEGGRCRSSGSMDVMPSESNESLTTATETCSTALEASDTNVIGITPIVLKRSLHYLSQIHQLEKMVQDGKRHIQALQGDYAKREQEYTAEVLSLRQTLQRELDESRTQGWMVEKSLTGQVKCLTADNAALMRQVNHITNRMQEFERINAMMVDQYHNALSTVQAMEKDHKSAQKKIRELRGKLGAEKQLDAGVKENIEILLKEKQEMMQSIQKLEDRLVGQKDVNSRLLSEIEKMREERMKETERIKEEKDREFKIKIDHLRNKLDLQTARLRKEHSTTEILKAEFTSIRRELESQISARDVKIEELRRLVQTANEMKNDDSNLESDIMHDIMEGEREEKEQSGDDVPGVLRRKESEIRVLENVLADKNKKFVDLQASLKEKEVQLTKLQEDINRRQQLLEDANESCGRLNRQKGDLDEQVENQTSEIFLLRENLASRDRRIVQMAADLSRRDRRIMTLLNDLREQSSSKATGSMTNDVKDTSSSSASTSAATSVGQTDEGSLTNQGCDDHDMDEKMRDFEKQLQELKQYKSEAEHHIQTLQRDLETRERRQVEMERLRIEQDELYDFVRILEQDSGIRNLSPSAGIINRLDALFQNKENRFTREVAAIQEANRETQGMIIKETELATQLEDKQIFEENKKMKLELDIYRSEVTALKEELMHNRHTAETQIDSLTSLLTSYKQHIESQQILRQDADQMVGHYIAENTQLKTRLDQSSLEHENMAKELAAAENLKSYCIQEKQRMEKDLEDLKVKLEYIRSESLKERDQHKIIVDDLSQKLDQKCNELSTTSNNLEQVLSQVTHSSEHAQELSRRLGEREDEIHDLNIRLLELDGQRNRIDAEKRVLENQCDTALQKIGDLEMARTESKETIFQNEGKTEQLLKEINDLKLRLTCEMNNYEHLKTLHLNLEETNRNYIEQIHQLQTELVNLKGNWAIRSNDLEKMKELKNRLESDLKAYQSQYEDMQSKISELEELRETDHRLYEEMKDERDEVLKSHGDSQEECRKAKEKIEKLRKTLILRRKKIAKLQHERSNHTAQVAQTSSTTDLVETQERSTENHSREEHVNDGNQQQQQHLLQQRQEQQFLQQELQRNRAASITHDITELRDCLNDSRLKLGQLTENQDALIEENEWLNHELEATNAALDEEKTHHEEVSGKMKKTITELKHKRLELQKAKRELRSRSRAVEKTMSTLNHAETIRNDLGQENSQLIVTCREKDAQITLLHEIIQSHQDKISEQDNDTLNEPVFRDCEHETVIRELERKLEAAEEEIRSMKSLNCRLNIDVQVKSDYLTNQRDECTRLQANIADLQQDNWDLKQRLSETKHKLQTEKQLRKLLERRYDDELNDIKTKSSLLEDREKQIEVIQSKDIKRKLSKLEELLQKPQEIPTVNISDDQRQIHGLKNEIEKLETLRDMDREALDGLVIDLGAIKSLMTSEIHRATNQNATNHNSRTEPRAARVQQALRRAELSAIRMTSFPNSQLDDFPEQNMSSS